MKITNEVVEDGNQKLQEVMSINGKHLDRNLVYRAQSKIEIRISRKKFENYLDLPMKRQRIVCNE